ncbi:MAG: exodeoxyribonuclease VII large subunit [Desulfovibrionaceae bacterium]|nr:exodeoxyribonuclease VII large subunit [Desulfovibrionaceae bacterium]
MPNLTYSVSSLTAKLKQTLETDFANVRVQGEVAPNSCKASQSGHYYFTLGDENASLKCAWFYRTRLAAQGNNFDPLTGEVFSESQRVTLADLKLGGSFLCIGKINVYPPRGEYQLVVTQMLKAGVANLAQEFERLKARLLALGYFDSARKRPIPINPRRVALITSESGAAIRDFWRIAQNRGLSSQIRLFPTLVQGKEAVGTIIAAIEEANSQKWADVIVIIRGGGSLEDLWCFNDVSVAKAIFESRLPILAGIGHEIDITLADMTADLRAATPTEAAVLLWGLRSELSERLLTLRTSLNRLFWGQFTQNRQKLLNLSKLLLSASPEKRLDVLHSRLEFLRTNFQRHMISFLEQKDQSLKLLLTSLRQKFRPEEFQARRMQVHLLEVKLNQGMINLLERKQKDLLGASQKLKDVVRAKQQTLQVQLTKFDAKLKLSLDLLTRNLASWLDLKRQVFEKYKLGLAQNLSALLKAKSLDLEQLTLLLENNNPAVLLQRGYAMIEDQEGTIVSSITQASTGQNLAIHLADGVINVRVEQIKKS